MDKIEAAARELMAECGENKLPSMVYVGNPSTGRTIRAMVGNSGDILMGIAISLVELADKTKQTDADVLDALSGIIPKLREDMKK